MIDTSAESSNSMNDDNSVTPRNPETMEISPLFGGDIILIKDILKTQGGRVDCSMLLNLFPVLQGRKSGP
ncbi:hypothetical protein C5167_023583 [Papaver somniferum]|uniref:Uncharacterized protein n=1 Tax=Papaver somniferum TaxID=3469 RepID=A0A4Y7JPF9_PAPSO|nr:hypothetical protein C5167_023583 [Papaver somniferum]